MPLPIQDNLLWFTFVFPKFHQLNLDSGPLKIASNYFLMRIKLFIAVSPLPSRGNFLNSPLWPFSMTSTWKEKSSHCRAIRQERINVNEKKIKWVTLTDLKNGFFLFRPTNIKTENCATSLLSLPSTQSSSPNSQKKLRCCQKKAFSPSVYGFTC